MAPVVDLENSVLHVHTLYTRLYLLSEHNSGTIQILIIDPYWQDEVSELPIRNIPTHLVTGVERGPDVGQVIICGVVSQVSERHVGVEEL